jgi:lipooligosaccharide transport system permease protein
MFNLRWFAIWQRNYRVWLKLLIPSLLGNFGDPLIYLIALGYGIGSFIGSMDGMPYLVFLASGIVCSSAMNAATFEGMFSAYTRMAQQKTWEGMLSTPLNINDIVLGEMLWAGTKGLINATAILIVALGLGLVSNWYAVWILPIVLLMSTCFAGLALIVTAVAKGYDFFTYYLTLLITPMMFLSGVFFPLDKMPQAVQAIAKVLPLYNAVVLVRPLMTGRIPSLPWLHIGILLVYAAIAHSIAVKLARKRLIN